MMIIILGEPSQVSVKTMDLIVCQYDLTASMSDNRVVVVYTSQFG